MEQEQVERDEYHGEADGADPGEEQAGHRAVRVRRQAVQQASQADEERRPDIRRRSQPILIDRDV